MYPNYFHGNSLEIMLVQTISIGVQTISILDSTLFPEKTISSQDFGEIRKRSTLRPCPNYFHFGLNFISMSKLFPFWTQLYFHFEKNYFQDFLRGGIIPQSCGRLRNLDESWIYRRYKRCNVDKFRSNRSKML